MRTRVDHKLSAEFYVNVRKIESLFKGCEAFLADTLNKSILPSFRDADKELLAATETCCNIASRDSGKPNVSPNTKELPAETGELRAESLTTALVKGYCCLVSDPPAVSGSLPAKSDQMVSLEDMEDVIGWDWENVVSKTEENGWTVL